MPTHPFSASRLAASLALTGAMTIGTAGLAQAAPQGSVEPRTGPAGAGVLCEWIWD